MRVILAPTDFSDASINAVEYAAQLAKATQARLHLLHVYHMPLIATDVPLVPNLDTMERESLDRLERLGEKLQEKYNVVPMLKAEMGFTADEIKEYTEKVNADLIVLGMHGHSKASEFFIGSTTSTFIERSKTATLVIPFDARFRNPEWIAFATDLHEVELHSLDLLKEIAGKFNSKINIVNITRGELLPDYNKSVAGIKLDHYFEELNHLFFFPEGKDVLKGVDDFIDRHKTDWVAIIPRKHGLLDKMFGKSVTKKMVYHTHLPLLVLPEKAYPEPEK